MIIMDITYRYIFVIHHDQKTPTITSQYIIHLKYCLIYKVNDINHYRPSSFVLSLMILPSKCMLTVSLPYILYKSVHLCKPFSLKLTI